MLSGINTTIFEIQREKSFVIVLHETGARFAVKQMTGGRG